MLNKENGKISRRLKDLEESRKGVEVTTEKTFQTVERMEKV
jgi:hypothetical protein